MAGFHKVAGWGPAADRQANDFYPTPPIVTKALLDREEFPDDVLEPCAGAGHMVEVLTRSGSVVLANEPYPRGAFQPDLQTDFLTAPADYWWSCGSLVTNPPYKQAEQFIRRAIEVGFEKHAWLLRFQFIEGGRRFHLFRDHPPRRIWVFSRRVQVSERGLENPFGGMIVYAWFVWEKGYQGHPELRWIGPEDM